MSALLDQFFDALDAHRQLLSAGDQDGAERAFDRGVSLVRDMVHVIDSRLPDQSGGIDSFKTTLPDAKATAHPVADRRRGC